MRRILKSVTYSWFEENFIKNFSNANIPEFDTSVWIYWGYQTSRIGEIGMIQGKLKIFLRQVSGISYSVKTSTYRLAWGDSLKGSSDPSHFIFKINVGKRRIRHRTTLKLNDEFLDRLQFDWRWRNFKFRVVLCRIRPFPTLISENKWLGFKQP